MDDTHDLRCLFSAPIEEEEGRYVLEVPRADIDAGTIRHDETYRIALLGSKQPQSTSTHPQAPVEPGETRYVEIEDTGKQEDGIARVERGYVVIVPDGTVGERVKVEIAEVNERFAVAEILDR